MASSVPRLLLDSLSIVLIDLLLAGDNALVIALAVRDLPPRQRRIGTALGAAAAVVLRVIITIAAAQLLNVQFIKLAGGAFVIWIAVKVLADASSEPSPSSTPGQLLKAVWFIVVADITMSTDNVLAVAGAAHGNMLLIVFGLAVSIPFVVISSNLLVALMNRYPVVVYVGAGILGKVGAEMILTDPVVARMLQPSNTFLYSAEAISAAVILSIGLFLNRSARTAPDKA
jgi:YjbE family integral membrane protein